MYESLFKEMAAKLRVAAEADGYWSPSLLANPEGTPAGIQWHGLLRVWPGVGHQGGPADRATYEPAVRRGWQALESAVHPDGMLGSVQQVSDRPEQVSPSDTQFYGVGAFLLAGLGRL